MVNIKSKYTAVVRDEYGTHVIKCAVKDDTSLYFQIVNKDKNIGTPCMIIPANFGILEYNPPYDKSYGYTREEWKKNNKQANDYYKSTDNVCRSWLVAYYKHFLLQHLIGLYREQ